MTCELHDSYFCLMTIKHAIPKIEWAIELLYNSVTGSQTSWSQTSRSEDVVEKATTRLTGPLGPPIKLRTREVGDKLWEGKPPPGRRGPRDPDWVWRPVGEKMLGWEHVPERLDPRLSCPGERERHTAMSGGAGEVNMLQSLFSLELPLTHKHKPCNKVRGIFF